MEPPIELDELMRQIHAAAHPVRPTVVRAGEPLTASPKPVASPGAVENADLEKALAEVASMLPRAQQKTEVSGVPKILRSLYRNQGGFNGILLAAAEQLLVASRHLQAQNTQLQTRLDALEAMAVRQHEWTASLVAAHERQHAWMATMELCLLETGGSPAEWERRLKSSEEKMPRYPGSSGDGQDELHARVDAVDSHASRLGDHLRNLQTQVDDQAERYADWHSHYRKTTAHHDLLDQTARRLEERQHNDASYLKNQLWFLQRLMQPLLDGKGAVAPAVVGEPPTATAEHEFDALYLAFEAAMRGTREEVKERVRIYLPYVSTANAGTAARPVLDLGCGRGEWLEILREENMTATGVDLNTCMIEVCRERGLPVTLANALDHLGGLINESCGAVTAFHLIEHLPFAVLIRFFRECRRVLAPGGVAIFETPNPYNVLVGSGYFYHDFTHQRPLPPPSTKFLAEQMGFSKVEVLPLHPWEESAKVHGEGDKALEWRFNELFYGPQDYALIATP